MNLGILSVWIGVAAAIASTIASVLEGKKSHNLTAGSPVGSIASKAYLILLGAYTVAAVTLMFLFFNHDFAYKYVVEYSSRTQPVLYLISAFWAGQEGTFLFWGFAFR